MIYDKDALSTTFGPMFNMDQARKGVENRCALGLDEVF